MAEEKEAFHEFLKAKQALMQAGIDLVLKGLHPQLVADDLGALTKDIAVGAILQASEINDRMFDNLLEFASKDPQSRVLDALARRTDLGEDREKRILSQVMDDIENTKGWVSTGTMTAEIVLQLLAQRGALGDSEIDRAISYHENTKDGGNWVLVALKQAVLEKRHIFRILASENTLRDLQWAEMAKQKNADDEVWERMVEIADKGKKTVAIDFLWRNILGHIRNKDSDKWQARLRDEVGSYSRENKADVAGVLLRQEHLADFWDVDELIEWWGFINTVFPEKEIEKWSKGAMERIGKRGGGSLLTNGNRKIRMAGIKILGDKGTRTNRGV